MLRGLFAVLIALGTAGTARADRVDTLASRLEKGNYKVRISASLALASKPDARSVSALTRTLLRDEEPTVRAVAASSLGKLLPRLDAASQERALRALTSAAKRDRDGKVRRAAIAARGNVDSPARRAKGAMVVTVHEPSGRVPGSSAQLHAAVERIVAKHAPGFVVERKQKRKGVRPRSYTLASRIRNLKVVRRGSRAEVRCSVQVLIAPTDARGRETLSAGQTAMASGDAQVITSSSRRSIEEGSRTCVLSVVEQVTRRQVMPFLASARH